MDIQRNIDGKLVLTVDPADFNVIAHLVSTVRSDNEHEPLVRRAIQMADQIDSLRNVDPFEPEVIDGAEYNRLNSMTVNRINS